MIDIGLKLEYGIPSESTFARVWRQIDPEAFQKCFTQWARQVHEKVTGEIISIDGKTVCGSLSEARNPIHMISAWVSDQQMVLGQRCVEEKTNEITTVPLLLKLLDINGCIVTADAMSCQREITKTIIDGKGDYVLSLKGNQPALYEYAETYFKDALENEQCYPEMTSCQTIDKGHGRIEKRTYYLSPDLSGFHAINEWAGLAGIGMVCSRVTKGENETIEIRYAITSLKDVNEFARAFRTHWNIEWPSL